MRTHLVTFLAGPLLVATALSGCGDASSDASSAPAAEVVQVTASFYPLQWMAQQVGGRHVEVSSLTKPGAEPHDLELSPRDVASVHDADVVVYLSGFQPSVDDAVDDATGPEVFDARAAADLSLTYTPIEEGKQATAEAGSVDPHFWQDPTKLADVAAAFEQVLIERDPAHAPQFRQNARRLQAELAKLDDEFTRGLRDCQNKDLITSHNAFGYLARRYGLRQIGITGLTPEDEPAAADLAAVSTFAKENRVKTIYFETLVSPKIAETVADEAGVQTDVLDPIEGLNRRSQGADYLAIMRSNLANLRRDQPCG